MTAPKRFPYRDEIAAVRVEAEPLANDETAATTRRLAGRVLARRDMGKLVFLDLVDRSGRIQLLCPAERTGEIDVHLGDIVGVTGSPSKSRRGEPSLLVESLELLSRIRTPLPDTFHGLTDVEARYRKRYLDLLMNPESRADTLIRSAAVAAIRRTLDGWGFVEVETPELQPVYGGAFAEPFVTHFNALDADYYLRIASELYLKRLIVGGLEKVYEIGKDFRNEGLSFKHNPEFTMLEWYEAYADYRDTMERIEQLVSQVAAEVLGTTTVTFRGAEIDFKPPWRRVKFVDALEEHGLWTRDTDELRRRLVERDVDVSHDPTWAKLIDHAHSHFVDPLRLSHRALAVRPHDRRRPVDRRALRVLRGRNRARQRVQRDQRRRGAAGPIRLSGAGARCRRRRGGSRRSRLRRGAFLRHAADGRDRARHRPADDAVHRPRVDPRRDPVPGAARYAALSVAASTSARISSSVRDGSQPTAAVTLPIAGCRWSMSSIPCP